MAFIKEFVCGTIFFLFATLSQGAAAQVAAQLESSTVTTSTSQTSSTTPKMKSYTFYISYMNKDSSRAGCPQPSSPDSESANGQHVTVTTFDGSVETMWQCLITVRTPGNPPKFPPSTPDEVKSALQSDSPIPDDWSIDSAGNHYTYYQFPEDRYVPTLFTGAGIVCETGGIDVTCDSGNGMKPILKAHSSYKQAIVSARADETTLNCQVSSPGCRGQVVVKLGTMTTMQCCNNNLNGGPWACQKDMHGVSRWDGVLIPANCGYASWMCPNPLTPCS